MRVRSSAYSNQARVLVMERMVTRRMCCVFAILDSSARQRGRVTPHVDQIVGEISEDRRFPIRHDRVIKQEVHMSRLMVALTAFCFAIFACCANAQSTDTKVDAAKAKKDSTPPTSGQPAEAKKYKPSGKETMDTMLSNQTFKGSKPVDKNAKAQAPVKDLKQMTPEERAERRKEIAKEAKP
jgi:hypothetical protein